MQWSPRQDAALQAVANWLADPNRQQVFRLFGYAGTGKTTLAKHFAESCGGVVLFGAFTGKAASVMRNNGCLNARTLHQIIYKPQPKSEVRLLELRGHLAEQISLDADPKEIAKTKQEIQDVEKELTRPSFVLNFDSDVKRAKLLIIDECSMVNNVMGMDLLSFNTPILVLGDPFQLPPVIGSGFFTNQEPDIMLTEIHRQAENSPVIEIATLIREGFPIQRGTFDDSLVIPRDEMDPDTVMGHDQILVGKNTTRNASNVRVRELLGRGSSPLPVRYDKLVCLRNDHKIGLLNGEIWTTLDSVTIDDDTLGLTILNEETKVQLDVEAHRQVFEGRDIQPYDRRLAQEFDFGYALTTHKAQGSQWDSVVVFNESRCFKNEWRNWLYTAVTRAAKRVTIVLGY